jgi:hypothetical protein
MTDPLPEAYRRLREEVRLAEAHLAKIESDGGSFAEQLAAASSVWHAQRVLLDTGRGTRDSREILTRQAASGAAAEALGEALAGLPEPDSVPDPNPDSDDPLAALFR